MVDVFTNGYELKERFRAWDRDYYSVSGYEAVLKYYDSIDPNMEIDVIAICCEWDEYGEEGCELSIENLISDKSYIYPVEDYKRDNYLADDDDFDQDDYVNALVRKISDQTTVIELNNGNHLIACF